MRLSWLEISPSKLYHNLRVIRDRLPASTDIIAVVKADAYGHGVETVSKCLLRAGIRRFAVATLEEAIELRQWAPKEPILVFSGCQEGQENDFRHFRLTASLFDDRRVDPTIPVELKIDTGMSRLGIPWTEVGSFLQQSRHHIQAVFSHFASADTDPGYSALQLKRFLTASEGLGYPRHIANSAGLRVPGAFLDAVRIGLSIYGISPGPDLGPLRPILTWKARILSIKMIPSGSIVGYGGTYSTQRPTRIGILGAGYADGYQRLLSNRGKVRIGRTFAPVLGRVSMDMTTIDLTDLPLARVGDEAILVDSVPESPISASALANELGTIPYEVLTSIGRRVHRVQVD